MAVYSSARNTTAGTRTRHSIRTVVVWDALIYNAFTKQIRTVLMYIPIMWVTDFGIQWSFQLAYCDLHLFSNRFLFLK